MDLLQIGLRIVHIVAGVAWVGGAALFFLYIEPTINKLGPDGEKFVDEVVNKRKLPVYFMAASTLTVLAGLWLYWRDTAGLQPTLVGSPPMIIFAVGGISALIAWVGGNLLIPKALQQVSSIGAQMKAAGGPPPPDLVGPMHAAQARLRKIGLIDLVLLGIAVLAMAVARYLG